MTQQAGAGGEGRREGGVEEARVEGVGLVGVVIGTEEVFVIGGGGGGGGGRRGGGGGDVGGGVVVGGGGTHVDGGAAGSVGAWLLSSSHALVTWLGFCRRCSWFYCCCCRC